MLKVNQVVMVMVLSLIGISYSVHNKLSTPTKPQKCYYLFLYHNIEQTQSFPKDKSPPGDLKATRPPVVNSSGTFSADMQLLDTVLVSHF